MGLCSMLRVRDLHSGYRQGEVLHGVDLDVEPGGALAILGRNGAGKSTLVLSLMGLVRPTAGSVRVGDQELAGARTDQIARAGVALVPQGRRIWPNLTVMEHLALAGRRAKGPQWSITRLFDLFPGLELRKSHQAWQLSGGEQQMLAIARALVTQPRVLMLDEPSEGLAPAVVEHLGEIVKGVAAEGVAIVLVEHDLSLAFTVAAAVAVLSRGEVAHRASTEEFRRDPETAHRLLGITA